MKYFQNGVDRTSYLFLKFVAFSTCHSSTWERLCVHDAMTNTRTRNGRGTEEVAPENDNGTPSDNAMDEDDQEEEVRAVFCFFPLLFLARFVFGKRKRRAQHTVNALYEMCRLYPCKAGTGALAHRSRCRRAQIVDIGS